MVVRMRHTRAHTGNRRSHHKIDKPTLAKDEAGNAHLRHRASSATGMYRGRKVLDLTSKLEKLARKTKEKEVAR